jgi:hypothetical protein
MKRNFCTEVFFFSFPFSLLLFSLFLFHIQQIPALQFDQISCYFTTAFTKSTVRYCISPRYTGFKVGRINFRHRLEWLLLSINDAYLWAFQVLQQCLGTWNLRGSSTATNIQHWRIPWHYWDLLNFVNARFKWWDRSAMIAMISQPTPRGCLDFLWFCQTSLSFPRWLS